MKIAFVVSGFPVLSETFILNQITGLLDLGQDVEIFAGANPKGRKIHSIVERYHLMKRVHYFNIPTEKINRVLAATCSVITNLHKDPVKILKSIDIFKYRKDASPLKLLYWLIPFLNKNFDIIHCHFGPNGIIGVLLKEIGIKGEIVTTFHGYDMSAFVLNNSNGIYENLFCNGDLFMPISDRWEKKLIELGCDKKKIIVHHMGIDLGRFRFSERKKRFAEPIRILTVGRLVEKKGHEYAIKAAAKIVTEHKNIAYIIAGDGPLRSELESLVSRLGIGAHVRFLGALEQDEILKLYQQAHIFICPSITAGDGDQEGTPVVLMEAQATGLPTVCSCHSGIAEVVRNGRSGFLVPERDVNALADRLDYLIDHPDLWSKMGKFGRQFVEEHYNIKKLNRRLVRIYQSLLNGRRLKGKGEGPWNGACLNHAKMEK